MTKNILIFFLMAIVYSSCSFGQSVDMRHFKSEPYELSSKVIVFTNWFFVRPGFLDWTDESGKSVYGEDSAKLNPREAKAVAHDSPSGIKLFVEPAKREMPIIKTDKPWDMGGIKTGTLIFENGIYRLWGACQSDNLHRFNCYFESKDGSNWIKPELGLIEFDGNKNNNLFQGDVGTSFVGIPIFVDPVAPAVEKYKTMWKLKGGGNPALVGAVSTDGFTWSKLKDPLAFGEFDTQNIAYYDLSLKKYVFYVRAHMVGRIAQGQQEPKNLPKIKRRAIGIIVSDGFESLPEPEIIIEPSPDMHPSDQIYTNCYTTIPGAPDHHLMFPTIWNTNEDETRVEMYSSYNGKNWHRVPGSPVYTTQNFGEPDGGCLFANPNLVERPNGDWILPYTGYNVPHKYPRGLFKFEPGLLIWSKGRLAGIEAEEKGEFATVAFVAPGSKLKINALTHRAGYIKVEVVGMDGKPIKGHSFGDSVPINGDQYKSIVTWQSSDELGVKKGEPVYLRFEMKMAKIYELFFE